jgi:hypothetical protein
LDRDVGLEPQVRAFVLTGDAEGVRMPCRSWRYFPQNKEEKRDGAHPCVRDFVLEVGVGDKTPKLRALAESYIKGGTLCVMTVKVEHEGNLDFVWSYSIYRRRSVVTCSPPPYDMVCDAEDVRMELNEENEIRISKIFTLHDFLPSSVLQEHGVGDKNDSTAAIDLSITLEQEDDVVDNGLPGSGKTLSKHLEKIRKLL